MSLKLRHVSAQPGAPRVSNLAELVRRAAVNAPDRPAVVTGGRRVSFSELDRMVDAVAAGLVDAGLVAGFRVALALANSIEFVTVYFGALRAGLVAVPLPSSAELAAGQPNGPEEYRQVLADVRARMVVADATTIDAVRTAVHGHSAGSVPAIMTVGAEPASGEIAYADVAEAATGRRVPSPVDPELLAVLLHTSGASGSPRIVMLSHAALLANAELTAAIEPPPVTADDVVLGVLPFCHVYGLAAVLGQAVYAGAAIVPVEQPEPAETLRLIAELGVTVVPAVPPMLRAWLDLPEVAASFAEVRLVSCGGAMLPAAVAARFASITGRTVWLGYGLTEAAATVTSTLCSDEVKPGSVGKPLPGVELRVVDERGVDIGASDDGPDPGEIVIKGPQLFSGYWPDGAGGPDAAGWFATGDLGYLDGDGDLFLIDRVRELIVVSGFHVYPHEVESVIRELDGVVDAAVVAYRAGTEHEAVKAFVALAPGAPLDADAVRSYCRSRLARFKNPTVVEFVAELPRTAAGKVAKIRLWERTSTS